jgi:hypothetical protein
LSWTWDDPCIAAPRQALTDRARRWVTLQVGRHGRSVSELAGYLTGQIIAVDGGMGA